LRSTNSKVEDGTTKLAISKQKKGEAKTAKANPS
jgi:hypothetical protein